MSERIPPLNSKETLRQDLAHLEETSGFHSLSERQQAILRHSLYLQERSERPASTEIDTGSGDPYPILLEVDENGSDYTRTQRHIMNWYCHAATMALEQELPLEQEPKEITKGFFQAEYEKYGDVQKLKEGLMHHEFPVVVHVSLTQTYDDNDPEYRDKAHSFVVLGKDKSEDLVIWEKEGYTTPYRISKIEEVFNHYESGLDHPKGLWWGVRPLRSHK